MSILITLGWIALIVGVILLILGYTVAPPAQRPGWAALILGLILVLIGYLVPSVTGVTHEQPPACVGAECPD